MKPNPFLSSQDIFAKAPRKLSVQDQPNIGRHDFQTYGMGGLPNGLPSSATGYAGQHNQSSQLSLGARLGSQTAMSPLTANLSEYQPSENEYGVYSAQQQFHTHNRPDSRSTSNYELAGYGASYSRTTDNFYNEPTRDRAVTLNAGSVSGSNTNPEYSRMQELSVYSHQQHTAGTSGGYQPKPVEVKVPSQFDDVEFIERNMNAITACLTNSQSRDEICKLIGLSSTPSPQSSQQYGSSQQQGYRPPVVPQPITSYAGQQREQIQHQQIFQPKTAQPGAFTKKLVPQQKQQQQPIQPNQYQTQQTFNQPVQQPPPQQPTYQQPQPQYEQFQPSQRPKQQSQQQQEFASVSPLQPLENRTSVPEAFQKSRQPSAVAEPKRYRQELSINYQSDEEDEQFDFNENRDDEPHESHHPSRKYTHTHNQAPTTAYCSIRLQPDPDPTVSLKDSLIRQMEQCTTRNGLRTFLTASEQFQLRRYPLR